jgi:hypothetical protein
VPLDDAPAGALAPPDAERDPVPWPTDVELALVVAALADGPGESELCDARF